MLKVDHVCKEFGSVRAVQDVTLTVSEGTTYGLLGPNGAGKTTTMRMILGILVPDRGSVQWNGARVNKSDRRHFGYLPEERGLYGKMKTRDQIAYFARLHGMRDPNIAPNVNHWIERLELGNYADRPCSELSKGNQQKVQIACAAVHRPALLVLDEPFSGLDPVNADMLLSVLNELRVDGTSLVLSSHQMWQLEELCNEFTIIADGCNRTGGTLEQMRTSWPTRVVRVAPDSATVRNVLESTFGSTPTSEQKGEVNCRVPAQTDFAALLRSLVAADAVTKFEVVAPSLHEIYLRAIGERAA